jgi:hypothetical protein
MLISDRMSMSLRMRAVVAVISLAIRTGAVTQESFTLDTPGDPFEPGAIADVVPPKPQPWTNTAAFARAIAHVDRVVVRDGGFNCCGPVDNQQRLVALTNVQEIAAFRSAIQFEARQEGRGGCLCCGYPGIDWYQGTNRVALTAVQHGTALRWKDFPGDAMLTPESSHALARWLLDHGVPDPHGELTRIAKEVVPAEE